jgi:medium-chain acyl-[acyl-carrier-protein] hydrolase
MYTKEFYIHTYEVDKTGRLLVTSLLNYFQDVMVHNVDSFGASSDYHFEKDLFWVLIDYEIDIYELPRGKTYVSCGTSPYSFKRFYGYRIWEMRDPSGKLLAEAKGKFLLLNVNTHEIVTPDKDLINKFKGVWKAEEALHFTKNIALKSDVIYTSRDTVKNTYIDIYKHMNNVYYLKLAYNTIPHELLDNYFINKIRITFKKECIINDNLLIEGRKMEDNLYFEIIKDSILLSKINLSIK